MAARKTLYEILQISQNASPEVMQAAYEKVLRRIEDERTAFSHDDTENRLKATREAYRVLSDPQRRAVYNQTLIPDDAEDSEEAPASEKSPVKAWVIAVSILLGGLGYYNIHLSNQRAAMAAEATRAQAEAEKERLALEQERLKLERTEKVVEVIQARQQEQDQIRSKYEMDRIQREIRADEANAAQQAARQKLLDEQAAEAKARREQYEAQARIARERAALSGIQKGRDARLNY